MVLCPSSRPRYRNGWSTCRHPSRHEISRRTAAPSSSSSSSIVRATSSHSLATGSSPSSSVSMTSALGTTWTSSFTILWVSSHLLSRFGGIEFCFFKGKITFRFKDFLWQLKIGRVPLKKNLKSQKLLLKKSPKSWLPKRLVAVNSSLINGLLLSSVEFSNSWDLTIPTWQVGSTTMVKKLLMTVLPKNGLNGTGNLKAPKLVKTE